MSGGNRLYHIAVGGWLITAILLGPSALAQDTGYVENYPAVQAGPAQEQPDAKPPSPLVTPNVDASDNEQSKGDPNYYSREDLDAQRRMAVATEELVALTSQQIDIISLEVGLVVIAIGVAIWAALEARKAAKGTVETVRITRDTAQRQLRAYIACASPLWQPVKTGNPKTITGYNFKLQWENCGLSPARRCRSQIATAGFVRNIPNNFEYPDMLDQGSETETAHVGPKQTNQSIIRIKKSLVEAAERGEKRIFVWGWFEYNDIFMDTPRHRTEVCVEVRVGTGGKEIATIIVGPFNGADEDCHHKPKT